MIISRNYLIFIILGLFLLGLCYCSLGVGISGWAIDFSSHPAVFSYRLIRILLALIAGSSLAASGASLQALFQNPLADPHLFGISGGAALGAALVIAFSNSTSFILPGTGAFIGGIIAFVLVFFYLKKQGSVSLVHCLLVGILINALSASIITLLKTLLPATKTQSLLFWLVGNLNSVEYSELLIIIPLWIIGLSLLLKIRAELELLSFGTDESRLLGVDTDQISSIAIIANCILIANVVSFAGLIGFIGLVIPNMVRSFLLDLRLTLPVSMVIGAIILVFFDMLSRVGFFYIQSEIPVGALTALFLSPLFFIILLRHRDA